MTQQRTLAKLMPSASASLTSAAKPVARPTAAGLHAEPAVSLCETLDRVLAKGIVAKGEITISVAGIDLLYVGLGALVASVDAARDFAESRDRDLRARASEPGPSETGG